MPFLVLDFPAFDPVIVSIGPFAIRWYALAYIFGILLGWLYARAIIRNETLWGGKAPLTVDRFRRFHRLGHARHHSRRPHRLCAVLQPGLLPRASGRNPAALEWRHVVPWRLRRLRARGGPVRLAAENSGPVARRPHLRGRRRSGCSSGGSPISSMANCGGARPTCPGRWCFPAPDRCRAIRASFMKPRSKGFVLLLVLAFAVRAGALKRPGLILGHVRDGLCDRAQLLRNVPRARCAAWLSVRRPYHGHAAVGAAVSRGPRLCGLRAEARVRAPELTCGRSVSSRT